MIEIYSQKELERLLRRNKPNYNHLISITNPGPGDSEEQKIPDIFYTSFDEVLELKFYDHDTEDNFPNSIAEDYRIIPQKEHIEEAIEFFTKSLGTATGYIIHCWRGVSRSTAIGLGLLYLIHRDELTAARELIKIRKNSMPNTRTVRYFDEILGSNLDIYRAKLHRIKLARIRKELGLEKEVTEEDFIDRLPLP